MVIGCCAESAELAAGDSQAMRPGHPWQSSILVVPSFCASPSLIGAMFGHGCDQPAALMSCTVQQPGAR